MSLLFSATLLVGALLAFALILRKIRRAEVTIADSTFWFLFALSIVLMGLFRQIPFFFADLFSIESPANFVFVYVIAVLLLREFYTTVKVSKLQAKVNALVQREALSDAQARAAAAVAGGTATPAGPAAPAGSDATAARASVAPAPDAANVSAAATSPCPGKEDDHA
jgi:hypothetical protein